MNYFIDVGLFHRKFALPVTGEAAPHLLDSETFEYRLNFLREELEEFCNSHASGDLPGALDALVDLAWVAMGTAHYMHAPFDNAWREVVRANMSKILARSGDGVHKRGRVETIRKPPDWVPPEIARVIAEFEALRAAVAAGEEVP